jgi:hypothetical protein
MPEDKALLAFTNSCDRTFIDYVIFNHSQASGKSGLDLLCKRENNYYFDGNNLEEKILCFKKLRAELLQV